MPVIVPAIAAVAAIYTAKKGSDAAKNAAKTQSDSVDKGLALQKDIYQQQTTNLAPYRNIGQNSLANLGNFQSFSGVPGRFGAGVQTQYQHPLAPGGGSLANPGGGSWQAGLIQNGAQASPGTAPQQAGSLSGRIGNAMYGQMVQLQAPDGEVKAYPREQAQLLIQRGAKVVG